MWYVSYFEFSTNIRDVERGKLFITKSSHVWARISFLVPRWSTWRTQGPFLPLNKIVFKIRSSKFRSENCAQPCFPNCHQPRGKLLFNQISITVNYRQLHQSDRSDRSPLLRSLRDGAAALSKSYFSQNVHKVRRDLRMRHRSMSIDR